MVMGFRSHRSRHLRRVGCAFLVVGGIFVLLQKSSLFQTHNTFAVASALLNTLPQNQPPRHRRLGTCKISVDRSSYSSGDTIRITYTADPAEIKDSIEIYREDGKTQVMSVSTIYTCCECTTGSSGCTSSSSGGTVAVPASSLPGTGRYVVFLNRGGSWTAAESNEFEYTSKEDDKNVVTKFDAASCDVERASTACVDEEFCLGISRTQAGCADCGETERLKSNLFLLESLSKADFAFSFLTLLVLFCTLDDDTKPGAIAVVVFFIFLDFCFAAGMIAAILRIQAPSYIQRIIEAGCFVNGGNEQTLADLKSELENFLDLAIVELIMSMVVITIHCVDAASSEVGACSIVAWTLDFIELVLAGIGLFQILIPSLDTFEDFLQSMVDPQALTTTAFGEPVPCLVSVCDN